MIWTLLLWVGCTSTPKPDSEPEGSLVDTSGADVEEEVLGEGGLESTPDQNARHRMRMSVDQLRSSM